MENIRNRIDVAIRKKKVTLTRNKQVYVYIYKDFNKGFDFSNYSTKSKYDDSSQFWLVK